ncbi:unnamed protein product [Hermetia illucens]|uniref:Uncharacterized protein n=1 Tax=Hermetia illucens TaxID=343691 RepID=A0A7R8UT11_HERIL|nr:unnamed protein product [Hermetia illucens]
MIVVTPENGGNDTRSNVTVEPSQRLDMHLTLALHLIVKGTIILHKLRKLQNRTTSTPTGYETTDIDNSWANRNFHELTNSGVYHSPKHFISDLDFAMIPDQFV